jgi:hypothetical protein
LRLGKIQTCKMFLTDVMLQVSSGSLTAGVAEGAIRVRRVDSATTGVRAS